MGKIKQQELDATVTTKLSNSDAHIASTTIHTALLHLKLVQSQPIQTFRLIYRAQAILMVLQPLRQGLNRRRTGLSMVSSMYGNEGASQTSDGYGSDDRWVNYNNVSTKTHSQQAFAVGQSSVPNNPKYYSRTIVVSGFTAPSRTIKEQRIEDVEKLAGKTVTLSFWAKADANKNLSINSYQYLGSGGSGYQLNTIQKFALTTSWQRFTKTFTCASVSGKTIGSSSFTSIVFCDSKEIQDVFSFSMTSNNKFNS